MINSSTLSNRSRRTRTILYPELTPVTKKILPKSSIYEKLNKFNDKYISVVPSTSQLSVTSLLTKYQLRDGKRPYESCASDARYLKSFKKNLGVTPTTKEIPHRVLLPFSGMREKRDEALLHFEDLPTLDKFFLINLVVWGSVTSKTNKDYTPIDPKTFISRRLKRSTFDELIVPGTTNNELPSELQNIHPDTRFKYLVDTAVHPRSATTLDTFYPYTASISDIEKYECIPGGLSNISYVGFSNSQHTYEYRTLLGSMLSIQVKGPKEDNTTDHPNNLERVLYLAESDSNHYGGTDDSLFSGSMILPLFDHALGIGRNVDLSKAYHYISSAEYLLKSISSLITNIYAATLPEARNSNGTEPTLLDFFGKHNLFDKRAAAFVRRVKKDMQANNHVTMWYNICKATQYLDTSLRQSGVKNGLGGLYTYLAARDPALFMVSECKTGADEFLDAVERGDTGSLKIMSVPGALTSPGMQNADPYIRSAILKPDKFESIRNATFTFTTEFDPFALNGSSAYKAEMCNYPTINSPFQGHLDGIELLSCHILRLNRELQSSLLLKSHNSPYLKSLHKIFMSYVNAATTSGIANDINDPDHVLHLVVDTTRLNEAPESISDYRHYTPVSITDGDVAGMYLTIPYSIHSITANLRQPSLKDTSFAFEGSTVTAFPNNGVVQGIMFQGDITNEYDITKDSFPGVWPPESHRHLIYYAGANSDVYDTTDIHDVFTYFSFINSSQCKPGDYDLLPTTYGAMYDIDHSYACRTITYANIADKKLAPSTPIRYQVTDMNDDNTERITTVVEDGVPRQVPIYIDRGINALSALTYYESAVIPRSLARSTATPGAMQDHEYACNIRDVMDNKMRQRTSPNYLHNIGIDTKNMDLIFSVSEDLTDSNAHIRDSGLEMLVKNIHSISYGMNALSIVLTDYLAWRSENFPDDTRFLSTTLKLRDLCLKYGRKEFSSAIITNIISQALNGDSIDILREV